MKKTVFIFLMLATPVHAADVFTASDNYSYLSDTKYLGNTPDFVILDKNRQLQLSQQYSDMTRQYEWKQNAGTMTLEDRASYNSAMTGFSQDVLDSVKSYQEGSQKNKFIDAANNDPDTKAIADASKVPAAIVGGTWALYKGTSRTFKIANGTNLTTGASIHDRSASVGLVSPFINTSVSADQQNYTATMGRTLIDHVSINLTDTVPTAQNPNPPSKAMTLGYGINL